MANPEPKLPPPDDPPPRDPYPSPPAPIPPGPGPEEPDPDVIDPPLEPLQAGQICSLLKLNPSRLIETAWRRNEIPFLSPGLTRGDEIAESLCHCQPFLARRLFVRRSHLVLAVTSSARVGGLRTAARLFFWASMISTTGSDGAGCAWPDATSLDIGRDPEVPVGNHPSAAETQDKPDSDAHQEPCYLPLPQAAFVRHGNRSMHLIQN